MLSGDMHYNRAYFIDIVLIFSFSSGYSAASLFCLLTKFYCSFNQCTMCILIYKGEKKIRKYTSFFDVRSATWVNHRFGMVPLC